MGQVCAEGKKNEGRLGGGSCRGLMRGVVLLVVLPLIVPSSGAPPKAADISRHPLNVSVATGKRAEFSCGMPKSLRETLTFTLYAPKANLSLTCVGGQSNENAKVPPGRYHNECKEEGNNLLAVWSIVDAKLSDNDIYVRCQLRNQSSAAFLSVYESNSFAVIIGCSIGGFITTLVVFGVLFRIIRGSEKLQQCFRGPVEVEDDITMATVE